MLGFASLLLVQLVVTRAAGALVGWLTAVGSLFVASMGIYLGRVHRVNSWDVVHRPGRLWELARMRIDNPLGNPHLIGYVVLFGGFLTLAYAGLYGLSALVGSQRTLAKPVEQLDSVVIRFAGDSGDGMQLTGGRFTSETALTGNDLATFPDYPAEIRAPAGSLPGRVGLPAALRRPRHPDSGRPPGRARRDEPGCAEDEPRAICRRAGR